MDTSPAWATPPEYDAVDTTSMPVIGPLKRAHAALDLLVEPLFASAPATSAEFDVMIKLRFAPGPMIAVSLARLLGRSGAAVSKLLAKLDRRGLVAREPNPADRRAALVTLTADGVALVDRYFPAQLAREAAAVGTLSPEQREQVAAALTALAEALEGAGRDGGPIVGR